MDFISRLLTREDTQQSDLPSDLEEHDEERARTHHRKSTSGISGAGEQRRIYFNMDLPASALDEYGQPVAEWTPNRIQTAKYTVITFLPKNLFEQFRGVANLYFLFVVILQIFPIFGANVDPVLASMPLIAILVITAIKDAFEDFKRHTTDDAVNKAETQTLINWTNVNVPEYEGVRFRRTRKFLSYFMLCFDLFPGEPNDSVDHKGKGVYSGSNTSSDDLANPSPPTTGDPVIAPASTISTDAGSNGGEITKTRKVPFGRAKVPYRPGRIPHDVLTRRVITSNQPETMSECNAHWGKTQWQNVRVGDFVRLEGDDPVPADIVILSTSEPDGLCYVETKNLDGETNLKIRRCLNATQQLKTVNDCVRAQFYLESEEPHANLYSYNGVLRWQIENDGDQTVSHQKTEAITSNHLLLRGSVLKNTQYLIGVVVFCGNDTKIMLNSGKTPSKRSKMEKGTNPHVIANFVILAILCIISAVCNTIAGYEVTSANFFELLGANDNPSLAGFVTFWSGLILYQNIVPISLYISVEIVKTLAAYFIHADIDMYYEPLDQPCIPKTWNISDDLGQIEYIFSDKTGTLTQNVMEFRKCTINGVSYGVGSSSMIQPDIQDIGISEDEERVNAIREMHEKQDELYTNKYRGENSTFGDPRIMEDLEKQDTQARAIVHFMTSLAVCHTALPEYPDKDQPYNVVYKAQSPDEAALVATARDLGFTFLRRTNDELYLEVMGEDKHFTLLDVMEFTSSRKRMSVIMRPPDGRIVLICKGADSVIYDRLATDYKGNIELEDRQRMVKTETLKHLEAYANEGLRTLCVAYRILSEKEYVDWSAQYREASASISNRDEKIEEVCEKIEHSFLLMGGTAIEDRLQEGVPDTIALLSKAGIKIWVLTGDKVETAINIGFACNLLQRDMILIIVNANDRESTIRQLQEATTKFFGPTANDGSRHALVIDGETLKYALDKNCKDYLLELGKRCDSVLCCRVSPLQKAKVVALVKKGLNVMTLAIGDGANDVSMIQEANVGIGISGEEGRQAVMASDYAIAQFRFLGKLLLVHGRWSYMRTAEMILTFFYKNIVWTLVLFWFQIFCSFTATMIFDYTYILLYNLVFTSLPCIFLGVFDKDLEPDISYAYPQLYMMGPNNVKFTYIRFWLHVLDAFYQSAVCFFVPFLMLAGGATYRGGYTTDGVEEIGTIIAGITVVVANFYVGFVIYSWTWVMTAVIVLSTLAYFLWTSVYAQFVTFLFLGEDILLREPAFWLTLTLTFVMCMIPRYVAKYWIHMYDPFDNDIIREEVICKNMSYNDMMEEKMPITRQSTHSLRRLPSSRSHVSSTGMDGEELEDLSLDDDDSTDLDLDLQSTVSEPARTHHRRTTSGASVRSDVLMYMRSGKRMSFTGFAFSSDEANAYDSFRRSVYRPKVDAGSLSQPNLHTPRPVFQRFITDRPTSKLGEDWIVMRSTKLSRSESAPADPVHTDTKDTKRNSISGLGIIAKAVGGIAAGMAGIPSSIVEASGSQENSSDRTTPEGGNPRRVRFATLTKIARRLSNTRMAEEPTIVPGVPTGPPSNLLQVPDAAATFASQSGTDQPSPGEASFTSTSELIQIPVPVPANTTVARSITSSSSAESSPAPVSPIELTPLPAQPITSGHERDRSEKDITEMHDLNMVLVEPSHEFADSSVQPSEASLSESSPGPLPEQTDESPAKSEEDHSRESSNLLSEELSQKPLEE